MKIFKNKKSNIKETKATAVIDQKAASQPQKKVEARAYKVLLRPIISEKATIGASQNKYVFSVAMSANKVEIKKAIKEIYGVMPKAVNILNYEGKIVRSGRNIGRRVSTKNAIVTLKKDDTIKLYEGT